jgi:eukaryotic-like serine/threonine-protein kinase
VPLTAGTRLGPYEIVASLGAGGMGEVYRARDPRLAREIALKILPAAYAQDPERLRRFELEARAASALNHPNIVGIHDVGSTGSTSYIVMELAEGESLRDRMAAEGAFSPRKTLAIGAQIADGLARAHAAGITHRDLKPENLIISGDGLVKILDFGLAKLVSNPVEDATSAPTSAGDPRTGSGVVLGTVGYMSPEQAAGRALDHRSDQFSLGSILYEMATGRRAFQADSAAQTLTAIIEREPEPVASLRPETPTPLTWVIERCLAKAPADRYDSTRDLARELANLRDRLPGASALRSAAAPPPARPTSPAARTLGWVAAALLLLLVALLAGRLALRPAAPAPAEGVIAFPVSSPEGASFHSGEILTKSALAPDGRSLALVAFAHGVSRLYLRTFDSMTPRPLAGTEGAQSPFWSPDGRFIAFAAEGKLKKIPVGGGPPQTICDVSFEGSGSWSREGIILFAEAAPGREGIHRVSAGGGERTRVTSLDEARKDRFHFWPQFLPDGRHFLYVAVSVEPRLQHEVRIGSLDSKATESLGAIDSRVEYTPPGYLLFVREGSLLARPFDAKMRRFTGDARPIVDRLYYFYGPANAGFSASGNGILAYEEGKTPTRLVWLDRNGRELSTLASLEEVDDLRLSSDGRRVAFDVADPRTGTSDIWVHDLTRGVSTRLTSDPADETAPIWSRDASRIVFRSDRHGPPDLLEIPSDGGSVQTVVDVPGPKIPEDVSPDGSLLLFSQSDRTTGDDLWFLPITGERKPAPFLRTRFDESDGRFSPDGRWIAYASDESTETEVYVSPRDGAGGRVRISRDGGFRPRWRRDGRELFFEAPRGRLMAASVKTGASLEAESPTELFRVDPAIFDYDVSPDGQRFLVSKPAKPPGPPITVVVHWPGLLKDS